MEFRDYYKTLGVSKTASDKEIKSAYRKLARKYHPDVNPGDKSAESRFKEVAEAYEVLSDPDKHRRYDEVGADWEHYSKAGAGAGAGWPPGGFGRTQPGYKRTTFTFGNLSDADFSDFFKQFFGGFDIDGGVFGQRVREPEAAQRHPARRDIEHEIEIGLEEAYRGGERSFELVDPDGSRRRIAVTIPAGVRNGSKLRVAGEGTGRAGARGDLYLKVIIRPHPRFELRGNDLHTVVDVPVTVAALGGEVASPTLGGANVSLTIPAETQNGRVLRLRGLGMPSVRGEGRGDLLVQVSLTMPRGLTDRERELFRELASLRGDKVGTGPSAASAAATGAASGAGENATRSR